VAALALACTGTARAAETPIGEPIQKNHMEIGAVYLQPVLMAPMTPAMKKPADIHIEADIRAMKGNPNGFGPGEWVPYLGVDYVIGKPGSDWHASGRFMAMVANDGPHYGANVKLDGPGRYRVTYRISPPLTNGLFRHTDKETGVAPWWTPFEVSWEFVYVGVGKKGGY
jgi:uncharacterized protein involved in high-affinity Fe2+ transport